MLSFVVKLCALLRRFYFWDRFSLRSPDCSQTSRAHRVLLGSWDCSGHHTWLYTPVKCAIWYVDIGMNLLNSGHFLVARLWRGFSSIFSSQAYEKMTKLYFETSFWILFIRLKIILWLFMLKIIELLINMSVGGVWVCMCLYGRGCVYKRGCTSICVCECGQQRSTLSVFYCFKSLKKTI